MRQSGWRLASALVWPCVPPISASAAIGLGRRAITALCVGRLLVVLWVIMPSMTLSGAPCSKQYPSTKEPAGLFRSDGKRPDGATLLPWIGGKYLTWDATVVHTCAASYIGVGSVVPASEQATNRKIQKYQHLPASQLFQPVAIETLGSFNQSALEFLSEMGRLLSVIVGDRRETAFLFQRLSVCIQSLNLVAFKGTFPTNPEDEA